MSISAGVDRSDKDKAGKADCGSGHPASTQGAFTSNSCFAEYHFSPSGPRRVPANKLSSRPGRRWSFRSAAQRSERAASSGCGGRRIARRSAAADPRSLGLTPNVMPKIIELNTWEDLAREVRRCEDAGPKIYPALPVSNFLGSRTADG